jgi:hypothetical protein
MPPTADPVAEPYLDYTISVTMNTYAYVAPAPQREAVDSLEEAPRPT